MFFVRLHSDCDPRSDAEFAPWGFVVALRSQVVELSDFRPSGWRLVSLHRILLCPGAAQETHGSIVCEGSSTGGSPVSADGTHGISER